MLKSIKNEGRSFLDSVSRSNEPFYLVLISVYVAIFFFLRIEWAARLDNIMYTVRYALLGIVMWGSAVYLFFVIVDWGDLWNKNFWLLFIGVFLLGMTYFFSKRMSTNIYSLVMDAFFCVMACGKDYRKILRCIMGVTAALLIIAGIGVAAGYTLDCVKPNNVHPGHSLGIIYPNTWGYMAFLVMMIIWYLWLRSRPFFSILIFWGMGLFMYIYICCHTVAVLMMVFPIFGILVDQLEKRHDRNAEEALPGTSTEKKTWNGLNIWGWLVTAIPFIAFIFVLAAFKQYEWLHARFFYTGLHNLALRFVQGALYIKTYGFHLFGNSFKSGTLTYLKVNEEYIQVGILDSSFASYLIMRGLVWVLLVLTWLCIANWKAVRKRDYAIPFLSTIILGFAMMERPGLEMWYNFILLYPLAKVVSKPGTGGVPEPAAVSPETSGEIQE